MTANHVEHEIATFPGSPGAGRPAAPAVKREAEEDGEAVTELERKHLSRPTDTLPNARRISPSNAT
jgi:hypothetical protein